MKLFKSEKGTKRTSEVLQEIVDSSPANHKISVQDFITKLSDRAFGLAIIIFALINAFVPGVSIIFSIPIFTIAIQIILGHHKIWVPKWIAKQEFSESIVDKALRRIIPTLRLIEKFFKPRMLFLVSGKGEKFLAILMIMLDFLVLLPIPGLNLVPSLCVCFIAISIMESDGLLALITSTMSILTLVIFASAFYLLGMGIVHGKEVSFEHMFNKTYNEISK